MTVSIEDVRRAMRAACAWAVVALMGLAMLTIYAADQLGKGRLRSAVEESVDRNTRDRAKSTELILKHIEDLKRSVEGTPHGRGLATGPETYTTRPVIR